MLNCLAPQRSRCSRRCFLFFPASIFPNYLSKRFSLRWMLYHILYTRIVSTSGVTVNHFHLLIWLCGKMFIYKSTKNKTNKKTINLLFNDKSSLGSTISTLSFMKKRKPWVHVITGHIQNINHFSSTAKIKRKKYIFFNYWRGLMLRIDSGQYLCNSIIVVQLQPCWYRML